MIHLKLYSFFIILYIGSSLSSFALLRTNTNVHTYICICSTCNMEHDSSPPGCNDFSSTCYASLLHLIVMVVVMLSCCFSSFKTYLPPNIHIICLCFTFRLFWLSKSDIIIHTLCSTKYAQWAYMASQIFAIFIKISNLKCHKYIYKFHILDIV